MVTAVASRCAALLEHKHTGKIDGAPCLPPLANASAPLSVEHSLVEKAVAALSDYFGSGLSSHECRGG